MITHGRIHGRNLCDLYPTLTALNGLLDTSAVAEDVPEGWSVRLTFWDVTSAEDSWARARRATAIADAVRCEAS